MATALDFEAVAISLQDAAVFLCDSRFVLGDVQISREPHQIRLRTAAPLATELIETIFAAWAGAEFMSAAEPVQTAQHAIPSEAVWAQHAIPSEAVWAQHAIPSEAVWAQHAIPSEAVWAQHAIPSESVRQPPTAAELNAMFSALAFADPAQRSWTPVTIVGRRDGRRCAVAIARASKLSLASRKEIRIDPDPSDPRASVAVE
jgi:hypothetical protein